MILVDTSVWVDHLRRGSSALPGLLEERAVLGHPWVTGELALGHLKDRGAIIALLDRLPQAAVADATEVLELIERHRLVGRGIGYVDAQLLAATRLTPDARLWTADARLDGVATDLGCAADI